MGILRREPERPDPNDVFVPAKLPLGALNAYVTRVAAEEQLDRYVRRGQTPVLFGEFGVGKTTLTRKYFQPYEDEYRLIYVPSAGGRTMGDVLRVILEHLDYTVEVERSGKSSDTVDASLQVYVAKAGGSRTTEDGYKEELVVKSPTDDRVLRLMVEAGLVLVIDEMHKASDEFRQDVADLIKAVRGIGEEFPMIVLIGTTMDAEQLVKRDPGIDRFVKELLVEPLTDDEAREIVTGGFRTLKLTISDDGVETIIRTSAGAPSIVQEVCLNMAESALADGRDYVAKGDYQDAVKTYLLDHGRRLASVYVKSIEQVGPKQYRKQILKAMATLPHDLVNMEDIRTPVSRQLGEEIPATALSGPLRELKNGPDSILQDVERQSGDRVYNLSAFRDPMMKSFIRFIDEIEAQGLLPPDRLKELGQAE